MPRQGVERQGVVLRQACFDHALADPATACVASLRGDLPQVLLRRPATVEWRRKFKQVQPKRDLLANRCAV